MKKTKLRKKSKSPQRKLEDLLWEHCRRITFEQYGTDCYTCNQKNLVGRNLHCGHMWPKASLGASLKYDIRILRPQCYFCNINAGGQGAVFYRRMLKEEGKPYMTKLEQLKNVTVKAMDHYAILLQEYNNVRL